MSHLNLGRRGRMLMKKFAVTLNIPYRTAEEIIIKNPVALMYVTDEQCLSISSIDEALNTLLSSTLLRDGFQWEPMTANESRYLKQSYNISCPPRITASAREIFGMPETLREAQKQSSPFRGAHIREDALASANRNVRLAKKRLNASRILRGKKSARFNSSPSNEEGRFPAAKLAGRNLFNPVK